MQKRILIDENGCWIWNGGLTKEGYGTVGIGWWVYSVHRIMYHLYFGKIDSKMELHHRCGVRRCCNPDHLEKVTDVEHGERHTVVEGWKDPLAEDVCMRGHVMDEENTYIRKDTGARVCRACNADRVKAWHKMHPGQRKRPKKGVAIKGF